MKVVFFAEGVQIPASRFRCVQFFESFERAGIRCEFRYGYGAEYNRLMRWPGAGVYKLAARVRRGVQQVRPCADVVFLQRTALAHAPVFEWLLGDVPVVFDFDDHLMVGADGRVSALREWAFRGGVARADRVIAGNRFLAGLAAAPDRTTVIPTVIDAQRYVPVPRVAGPVVLGWMGTAGNFGALSALEPSLRRVLARYPDVVFRLVSNADYVPLSGHPQVEQIRWQPQTEVAWLQSFDIGLMPLVDSVLTRGKCAFKMIQYMSVGRAVAVSAVGANKEVFVPGVGRLLEDWDWDEALSGMIEDERLRQEMGESGRSRVEEAYSIAAVLPEYLDIFDRLSSR